MIVQFFHRIESYLRRQKASALQSIMHAEFGYLDDFQEEDSISDKETLKKIKKAMRIWQFDTVKRELFTNTVNDTERYPMQNGEEVVQKDDFYFHLYGGNISRLRRGMYITRTLPTHLQSMI